MSAVLHQVPVSTVLRQVPVPKRSAPPRSTRTQQVLFLAHASGALHLAAQHMPSTPHRTQVHDRSTRNAYMTAAAPCPLCMQIRNGALECLQRSVVAAEKFAVPQAVVQRVLLQLLIPMTQDLVRKVAVTSPAVLHREFPQVRAGGGAHVRPMLRSGWVVAVGASVGARCCRCCGCEREHACLHLSWLWV